jgi:hypothetical protein
MKFYQQSIDLSRAALGGIIRTTSDNGPTMPSGLANPYQMDLGNGAIEDVSWVL